MSIFVVSRFISACNNRYIVIIHCSNSLCKAVTGTLLLPQGLNPDPRPGITDTGTARSLQVGSPRAGIAAGGQRQADKAERSGSSRPPPQRPGGSPPHRHPAAQPPPSARLPAALRYRPGREAAAGRRRLPSARERISDTVFCTAGMAAGRWRPCGDDGGGGEAAALHLLPCDRDRRRRGLPSARRRLPHASGAAAPNRPPRRQRSPFGPSGAYQLRPVPPPNASLTPPRSAACPPPSHAPHPAARPQQRAAAEGEACGTWRVSEIAPSS